MKSKFAKFVDYTLGSLLMFGAATAVAAYYLPLKLAAFCALSVTATVCVLAQFIGNKKSSAEHLSRAADDMFFEFMFLNSAAPAKHLYDGLKRRDDRTKLRGTGVYLGKTAAYPEFTAPIDPNAVARFISRAKHFGCNKVVIISKTPPTAALSVDGITIKTVSGNDTYKLYASLDCLPKIKYSVKAKRRFWDGYRGALGKEKIIRYAVLSAAFFAITAIFRFSVITLACAIICAALFIASTTLAIVSKAKQKRKSDGTE